MSNSFYLAACLLGTIWLIGLWKSVQRAFPEGPEGGHLDISRRVLFHLASLLAAASPVYTLLNGFTFLSIRIWAYTFTALYVLFFFWYMSAYRYSDFLFEASEFGISSAEKAAGAPKFTEIVTEQTTFRLAMKNADTFVRSLAPEP